MRFHFVLALAYALMIVAGVFVWLAMVVPYWNDTPLPVRLGAPAWWAVTVLLMSHHWRKR